MCNYRMQWSWSNVFTRRRISFAVHLLQHTHRGHIEWNYVRHKLRLHYRLAYSIVTADLTRSNTEYSLSAKLRNPIYFDYSSVVTCLNILTNNPFWSRQNNTEVQIILYLMLVFWPVTLRGLAGCNQRFVGIYCLHFQSSSCCKYVCVHIHSHMNLKYKFFIRFTK